MKGLMPDKTPAIIDTTVVRLENTEEFEAGIFESM